MCLKQNKLKQIRFMSQREIQVYSYTLNIQSIKMKVKFPCKMKLEYAGETLTSEVGQNDSGKFIFNQEVTLKEDTDRTYFEIIANIATDKGAKYIAGIIKLAQAQLVHQEGQMMVIHLSKCLDSEACCELRVDQVSSEKIMKKVPIEKVMAAKNKEFHQDFSPKKLLEVPKNYTGSRSEYQFPLTNSRQVNPIKTKEEGYQSIYQRPRSPANNFRKTNVAATYIERNMPEFGVVDSSNRDKLIEAEVYKQSYQKLKQKYKREAETAKHELNKRIALENNENNFKLEIMRLKLRCDEQEKTINDKNTKLKEMQLQLAGLQKKQLDLNYLREEASNKDHTIRMLEDTIRALNKDNQDLKSLNHERFENQQEKIRELRNQVDSSRQRYEAKIGQLEKELKFKLEIINQKEGELRVKEERIQRQQRLVDQLEKMAQAKNYEHERTLQAQNNQWKVKLEEFKAIIEKLEKQKIKLEGQLQSTKGEHDKIKTYVIKMEYDRKILTQETDGMKSELAEVKLLREKYQEIVREHRLLTEDKNHLQKQFEKTLQNKDSNLADLNKQYKQQIDHYRKLHKQIEEKLRNSQNKSLQSENLFEQKKNEAEKLRKNNEALTKECNDLKEKEKNLKRTVKSKQEEIAAITAQFESSRYKTKSGDQLSRYQIENLRQELSKCKRELDTQIMKSAQQTEKIVSLNTECSRSKLQLQQASDQNEKDNLTYKQKISSLENYNKEYEKRVDDLNSVIVTLRTNDKDSQMKIQKLELQGLKTSQKIEKQQKDIRMLEDKIAQNQNQIKGKLNQINNLQLAKQNLEKKLQENEEKLNNVKNNLNAVTGEKNKNDKIIQLLNRDIAEFKQEAERQNKLIQSKEKLEQDIRAELKKSKEEYLKLEMRNTALKKQYDRFKEHLSETLASTFSQLPLGPSDMKASSVSVETNGKRSDNFDSGSFNAQILNKINAQNKDIKVAMSKMIQHNKMLQKEIERLSQEGMSSAAKNQISESSLNKRIQELEDQINRVGIERDEQNIKNRGTINDLRGELEERENINKQLVLQLEELNFTVNSLRMDQEATNEHYSLKQTQYKSKIAELEEKATYLTNTLNQSEISCHSFESKLAEKTVEFENQKDINSKKEKQIQTLREEKKSLNNIVEDGKKQRKELLQKVSELELKLSTQIELKQKGRSLLEDEQRKGTELKDFVANLMKQKELAIKGDLEKSQQIISLQATLMEVNRQKDTQAEQIERLRKNVDEQKQMIKKQSSQIKDLEASATDQKGRGTKLSEKLREKQRQLKENEQALSRIRSEYQKLNSKTSKTISDLNSELEQKCKQKDNQIKQLSENLNQFEKEKQEAQLKITNLKAEILALEESLFMQKQASQVNAEQSGKLSEEIEGLKTQIKRLEESIASQNEQMKEKQQGMFQLSGKVYQLEASLQAKDQELKEKVSLTSEDWSTKYDSMVQQYEQRIELVEKEKSYFKTRLEEKQEEYRKIVAELRNNQLEDSGLRKALEEKVKRLEQQRLTLISSKNLEIQRLAEDNKGKFESLKTKQADLRRLQHELEVARTTINKLEQSKKETEQKIKHINKVYQAELEQLKRRQANTRSIADQMERVQWDVQREVKKTIQSYTKKISVGELRQENQKIISTIKTLEDEVISAISHKFNPASN